jgi:hypothetical protein
MQPPPLDPLVAVTAPTDRILTGYDEQHLVTYLRLLDAENDGADWAGSGEAGAAYRSHQRPRPCPARVGNAFGASALDHR